MQVLASSDPNKWEYLPWYISSDYASLWLWFPPSHPQVPFYCPLLHVFWRLRKKKFWWFLSATLLHSWYSLSTYQTLRGTGSWTLLWSWSSALEVPYMVKYKLFHGELSHLLQKMPSAPPQTFDLTYNSKCCKWIYLHFSQQVLLTLTASQCN